MNKVAVSLANGEKVTLRTHYAGCYRMTLDDETFGQIKRDGREWTAQIRRIEDGVILRWAGIWPSRREAVAELVDHMNGETRALCFRPTNNSAHCIDPQGFPGPMSF